MSRIEYQPTYLIAIDFAPSSDFQFVQKASAARASQNLHVWTFQSQFANFNPFGEKAQDSPQQNISLGLGDDPLRAGESLNFLTRASHSGRAKRTKYMAVSNVGEVFWLCFQSFAQE
ncbi:predicted protein [Sclerotinia sclerotiorum 1980 UF-70]|uniref:Uncharacterized protein n=1 Tax=Sclerotinia sclerotiorum (strain ATCC 18683 / 1980 / Ss-1) TaxID=665079 RepID=A7ETU2_SCLS1|nr:predicted protein [Sclerotinia sclerotiorum 1980 UF-70]EDN92884.1 predicted protein [Sclerotinia sclerotiorum 1980 UF-70]